MCAERGFVKRNAHAPAGLFAWEAAGLRWLSAVTGGVPCPRVIDQDATSLTLERLKPASPSDGAAREFGGRLAVTHDAGAPAFGAPPQGWRGPGFFGPLEQPLPMSTTSQKSWGQFYADERLVPMAELAAARLDAATRQAIEAVVKRCRAGEYDDDDQPARLHGDLWSGNVIWTPDSVVVIDPAAHGGHRESDLGMLALFGCPHLDAVLDGYQQVHPLRRGRRERIGLHQLFPLLAHVALFGAGYARSTAAAAGSALSAEN
jgi:fructosamine-3-kinase